MHVLCADPAWSFGDNLPGPKRGAKKHYKVLTLGELARFPLPPIATDALLFMWRVSSQIEEALWLTRAWGFTPKSEIVWIKTVKGASDFGAINSKGKGLHFGMGRYVRAAHESCIVASRGKGSSLIASRSIRSVFAAPVGIHSQKPEVFYDIVEELARGPYAELFARRRRPGWTCYGDELDKLV